ncbi:MAG: O-antigen ligase family protein [Candidatus Spechtbacteria bacterium]|nr:O-antigen ligase family protein [Candidatus Spechtbacteria bacterium]
MSSRIFSPLNIIYILSLVTLFAAVFGVVPREFIFIPAVLILGYMLVAPHQNGLLLFVRFIPFFFALPLTQGFDNFNLWRIAIILLFAKWILSGRNLDEIVASLQWNNLRNLWNSARAEVLGSALFALAFISLFVAQDISTGVKRIIYFANLTLLFVIVRGLVRRENGYVQKLTNNFVVSGMVAVVVGFGQWISTYFLPVWIFHYWWGQIVSLNMYGQQWANIVTNFGNTWFSYSGGGLRLRMFSLFPDSHTFPLYLLMVLPFLFLFIYDAKRTLTKWERRLAWFGFLALHLALILSGTRGIWAGIIFPAVALGTAWFFMPYTRVYGKKVALSIGAFILMFPFAWAILMLPQFQDDNVPSHNVFFTRIGSLIDTSETSNQGRIAIWRSTLKSIAHNPALGIGIGNYPVVLDQNISATRMGASAHNLYLQVASEMGIPAAIIFIWFLWEVFARAWRFAQKPSYNTLTGLFAFAIIFSFIWILGYSLTDAALFDERAFLGFLVFIGVLLGITRQNEIKNPKPQ